MPSNEQNTDLKSRLDKLSQSYSEARQRFFEKLEEDEDNLLQLEETQKFLTGKKKGIYQFVKHVLYKPDELRLQKMQMILRVILHIELSSIFLR